MNFDRFLFSRKFTWPQINFGQNIACICMAPVAGCHTQWKSYWEIKFAKMGYHAGDLKKIWQMSKNWKIGCKLVEKAEKFQWNSMYYFWFFPRLPTRYFQKRDRLLFLGESNFWGFSCMRENFKIEKTNLKKRNQVEHEYMNKNMHFRKIRALIFILYFLIYFILLYYY
jgi:hypothetical protein